MKGYSAFPKAPALLEPHHLDCLVSYAGHSLGGVLPLCREAVGVFYSPRLGKLDEFYGISNIGYLMPNKNMICYQKFYR